MKIIDKFIILLSWSIGFSKSLDQSYRFNGRQLLADWCSLKCGPYENIACEVGKSCKAKKPCEIDKANRKKLLEMHNKLRDMFASGNDDLAKGIRVSNMMALNWDDDLAFTAKCNVARCLGKMEHDKCRITAKFHTAGQNLWSFSASGYGGAVDCAKQAIHGVQSWYNEIKLTNPEKINQCGNEFVSDPGTGHFTQVIWAKTTHIGCAITKVYAASKTDCIMACNYGPAGNMLKGSMFQAGEPCSKCPEGVKCGSTFKSLCGEGGDEGSDSGDHANPRAITPSTSLLVFFLLLVHLNVFFA